MTYSGAMKLPDPEQLWERSLPDPRTVRALVEARVGPVGPIEVLSGGQANLLVRVHDRVVRIHVREPESAAKEAALLRRPWGFRVPPLLDAGHDYLVLGFVSCERVPATEAAGGAVGRALAEIHATAYPQAGLFGADLRVHEPFPDVEAALRDHVASLALPELAAWEPEFGEVAGPVLLHGDFKAANLRWTDGELLVLDWEFAWAGPALLDVGQLFRWDPPEGFARGFERAYREGGGTLPDDHRRVAEQFDLVNLAGLLSRAAIGSRRAADVRARIARTLARPAC